MNIVLATRNISKTEQIKALFVGSPWSILTLDEVGIEGEAVEDGATLKENALKKAMFAHQAKPEMWSMADDTGLFITALAGAPGIKAARWAGETATTAQITALTLNKLEGKFDRSATFETVVAIVSPDGESHFFSGEVKGKILEAERVPPQPKMPYSGIFVPEGQDLVWAEMSVEYENVISHRGKAFWQARTFLEKVA